MNIFVLDTDPASAARQHCDAHVIKMILESAQMLSTALKQSGSQDKGLYKATHAKHPCTKWAGETRQNFLWLCDLGLELAEEHLFRYPKRRDKGYHSSRKVIVTAMGLKDRIPNGGLTPFAQAMPEQYKNSCPVKAYRAYYVGAKNSFARYTHRARPEWFSTTTKN